MTPKGHFEINRPLGSFFSYNPRCLYKMLFFFSLILVSLSIDLSGYVGDLAKPFATQLHANDDSTRESAVKCVASLALKCSDSEAILTLLKSIFAVLNGSEGKLTVADHKISLLNAVASLADNSILGECFLDISKST